ncbi:MAG: leucine-rich repeat protein [Clostridia bacterium]|nr:leucine-rich repeat protein [Clostridia bacterium]
MKKLFVLVLGVILIMASAVIGISAAENGWSFAENELWEVEVSFYELPTAWEARVYPTDNTVEMTIIGNYARKYDQGIDLRLTAGGIPAIVLNTGGNSSVTTTVAFEGVVLPLNTWTDIRVEIDRTELCARCYIGGELKSTVAVSDDAFPDKGDTNIVVGGNRIMNGDGTHNRMYFRGYIERAAVSRGEETLFSYDYNAAGNTEKLMKDQSGAGNDAIFSVAWSETSGIEESGEEYAYRFAVVGDPQTISQSSVSQHYLDMYRWIASEKPDFIMTLGDIIQSGASSENELATGQWLVATEALGYLDAARIPHSDVKGNHCTRQQYDKYITYEKYYNAFADQGVTTICHEESMINSAYLFEISGVKYMIFALEYGPSESVLGWAGRLCEKYPEYNVIVTTHSYMGRDGNILGHEDPGDAIEGYGFTTGQEDWDWFIDKYPNIIMVICGHIAHDNVVVSPKENSCGTIVNQILIDFQSTDSKVDGAVGMVNMFNFTEDGKTVFIETYSTAQGLYYKSINQIKLDLDVVEFENEYAPDYGTKSDEGTVSGYNYALYGDTLVISGNGSGILSGNAPAAFASSVKTVVIENATAVNTIGASFFEGYSAVTTLVIPETLKTVGSKTFAGMSALNTVAYFNDYYSDSFAGEGIIDIRSVQSLKNDSLSGSGAGASYVYLSRFAEIEGEATALVAGDATYYTYPSGGAAQYMRSLGDAVNHSYYTEEMTGDEYLALSGTAYRNGKHSATSTLNWSFDIETSTLSITQGNGKSIRMHGEGLEFENFKATWNDLIKTLNMGGATYSQWESWEGTNSVPFGLTELENIVFAKKLDIDDKTTETGWFEGCTNLKNMKLASSAALEDGIIDLSWWQRLRGDVLDRMFKDCVSIKEVIFPETMILNNDTLTFRICESMFENCVNLERLTIPSYTVSIEADAFKGCENLETITIEATGFTVTDKSAFPDQEMTIYVLSPEDKATITALGYENIRVVCIANGTMESGYTWSISEDGQLTIGGSGNGKIEFASVPTADDLSAIPWNAFLSEITSVVIEESTGITGATAYALSNMPNCTTITLPTTFNDFTTDGLFSGNTSLTAITQQGTEPKEGVIDLRGANAIKASAFANLSAVIWIGKLEGAEIDFAGMGKNNAITFVSYPTCDAADDVRDYIKSGGNKNVKLTYYSEEFDAALTREGTSLNGDGTNVGFEWSFDEENGKLTINIKLASSRYQSTTEYIANWKPVWADAVYEIYVTGGITKLQYHTGAHGIFDCYDNLRKIHFVDTAFEMQNNTYATYGFFSNNPSLTTLGCGSGEIEEGVVDISFISKSTGAAHMNNLLAGCSSITSVKFRENAPTNVSSVVANMFKDCSSLVSIQIPAYATAIEAGAFDGCTNLKTITLMGDTVPTDLSGIPDKEGLRVICKTEELAESVKAAGAWTKTSAISVSGAFVSPVKMDGFSIRLEDYNGLRAMMNFDNAKNALNEAAGYTLVEYGAMAMSEAAYNKLGGPELVYMNGAYTPNAGRKVRVYSATEGFLDDQGKATRYGNDGDLTNYNLAVVNYTSNYASNVYMCAYAVYAAPTGETVVEYSHYSDDYKFFNLYDITLEMYKAGAINASVSDDAAVWNTLLSGAVTIASGDIYAEIPAVGRTASGVYTPSKTVTITLVLDTDDTSFVAIYRGTGAIPTQHNSYSNGYGGTSANQLGSTISTYSPAEGYDAIPVLSEDEVKLVKTIIMDHGITSISKYAFVGLDYATTYVYSTTVSSMDVAAFFYNTGITTAYCAHVDDPNKENEEGLCDFSMIGTCKLNSMFRTAVKIRKLHLPANVTNPHETDLFGNGAHYGTMALEKVWFGNNPEPYDNVADFSNITVSGIGSRAFMACVNIEGIILPDGCATIDAEAFNGSPKSTYEGVVMGNFKTVMQPTYHAGVAEYCKTNGLAYVDYDGNELKAPVTE